MDPPKQSIPSSTKICSRFEDAMVDGSSTIQEADLEVREAAFDGRESFLEVMFVGAWIEEKKKKVLVRRWVGYHICLVGEESKQKILILFFISFIFIFIFGTTLMTCKEFFFFFLELKKKKKKKLT